jgi:TRAP-type C4-dicarboxylate transport system substrate-binding protein
MLRTLRVGVFVSVAIIASADLAAQGGLNIRLPTFAPTNSLWDRALKEMGAEWSKITNGRVKLTVYAGGVQGDEQTVVRGMRPGIGQFQASLLLQPGLSAIDDGTNVFSMPFFLRTDAEFLHVLDKLRPVLARRFEAKGFHVLNWGMAGWIQLFSKREIRTLADLKRAKLFTTEGDEAMVKWYTANGFQPKALSFNEIPAQLKIPNGMIDAVPSPAYGALALQFFRDAPYMLELRVAPLVGATVIALDTWNKVQPAEREQLQKAADAMEAKVLAAAPQLDNDSIAEMKKRGLKVTAVDAAAAAEFSAAADKLLASMRGTMVPADLFELATKERDAFRASQKK